MQSSLFGYGWSLHQTLPRILPRSTRDPVLRESAALAAVALARVTPCRYCRDSYSEFLRQPDLFRWFEQGSALQSLEHEQFYFLMHNKVNLKLGKPLQSSKEPGYSNKTCSFSDICACAFEWLAMIATNHPTLTERQAAAIYSAAMARNPGAWLRRAQRENRDVLGVADEELQRALAFVVYPPPPSASSLLPASESLPSSAPHAERSRKSSNSIVARNGHNNNNNNNNSVTLKDATVSADASLMLRAAWTIVYLDAMATLLGASDSAASTPARKLSIALRDAIVPHTFTSARNLLMALYRAKEQCMQNEPQDRRRSAASLQTRNLDFEPTFSDEWNRFQGYRATSCATKDPLLQTSAGGGVNSSSVADSHAGTCK